MLVFERLEVAWKQLAVVGVQDPSKSRRWGSFDEGDSSTGFELQTGTVPVMSLSPGYGGARGRVKVIETPVELTSFEGKLQNLDFEVESSPHRFPP